LDIEQYAAAIGAQRLREQLIRRLVQGNIELAHPQHPADRHAERLVVVYDVDESCSRYAACVFPGARLKRQTASLTIRFPIQIVPLASQFVRSSAAIAIAVRTICPRETLAHPVNARKPRAVRET
jgi:hypothetical protein